MSSEPILPWRRTFAEGVAIVVSILLAFAIDAWWEDRRSTSRLNDAYSTILADLRDSKERIAFYRARTRVRSEAIIKLYELADENAADIDPEELDRTLGSLQWSVIENIVRSSGIQP